MNLNKLIEEINKINIEQSDKLNNLVLESNNIIIIGNGGSNSIASHIAIDYQKFLNKKVKTITDTGLLSMLVNDYTSDQAYSKFISMNNEPNTLVILISSSGNSKNIFNALCTADCLNCNLVILSGFKKDNILNHYQSNNIKLKFHVDSDSYGIVENTHQIFLHSIIKA
jgi:D-sedoheptulose 7-phosphate isomerase